MMRWWAFSLAPVALMSIAAIFSAAACAPKTVRIAQPEGPIPTAQECATAQQDRLRAVPSLALRGHAEFRWKDKSGAHFENGDFDWLVRPPSDLSLRISKLGEKFLWVGAGGNRSWIVLPKNSPSTAIVHEGAGSLCDFMDSMDSMQGRLDIGALGMLMDPARLIEAIGLAPIRASEVSSISWSETRAAWVFTLPNRRVYMRGESFLPVGCDWLNSAGQVVATCYLDGFEWIRGDRPVGSPSTTVQPLVATRLRFSIWSNRRCQKDGDADGELSIAAQDPSFGSERIRPQLFDWDAVKAALRPEVIDGEQR